MALVSSKNERLWQLLGWKKPGLSADSTGGFFALEVAVITPDIPPVCARSHPSTRFVSASRIFCWVRGLLNFFTTSISRQAVGKTMTIMVDANHAYDTMAPTRVGRQIEELDMPGLRNSRLPRRPSAPMPRIGSQYRGTTYPAGISGTDRGRDVRLARFLIVSFFGLNRFDADDRAGQALEVSTAPF